MTVREWCSREPWCLKVPGHPGECRETVAEQIARVNAQAMRGHFFIGAGPYCEEWSRPRSSGGPATGVVTMRIQCGYPREHHPLNTPIEADA